VWIAAEEHDASLFTGMSDELQMRWARLSLKMQGRSVDTFDVVLTAGKYYWYSRLACELQGRAEQIKSPHVTERLIL
jgi:hypothetical protein